MAALAARPNVAVKISGLGNVEHKREVVLAAIELFGTERAMFASNFPVDSLRATFSDDLLRVRRASRAACPKRSGARFSTTTRCASTGWSSR